MVLLYMGFMRHQRDVLCPWHLTWLSFISSVQTASSCTLQGVLRQTSLSETCSKSVLLISVLFPVLCSIVVVWKEF